MSTIKYKGFEISPIPYELKESGEWALNVSITKHHDARGETLSKPFSGGNTFKTQAEAAKHSIEFGKQIIDGKHPNISTDDLL